MDSFLFSIAATIGHENFHRHASFWDTKLRYHVYTHMAEQLKIIQKCVMTNDRQYA